MPGRRLILRTKTDFVARLSQAPTMTALEELIWNAFDENASQVEVILERNKLDGVDRIEIRDDGTSLEYSRAAGAFENLGSSIKPSRKLQTGEQLHGRKGEGRHKAFSLGVNVTWRFVYNKDGKRFRYEVIGTAGREDPFYLTEETTLTDEIAIGCTVQISGITRSLNQLLQPHVPLDLASVFAPYLLRQSSRRLVYNGKPIQPRTAILSAQRIRSFNVSHEDNNHKIVIEVIHWKDSNKRREVHLCSESGIPLHQLNSRALPGQGNYSVFVTSSLFESLHEQNLLASAEMTADGGRQEIVNSIWKKVRSHFRKLSQKAAQNEIERLREEGSYPYLIDPTTEIDKVERRVFDLCTLSISRHLPNFNEGMDLDGRKLLLRIVREAITRNPGAVGKIIREVCRLPDKEAKVFARLLDDVPLSKVVELGSMITDRLKFLSLFESTVYLNPFESVVRERTQLQKLLIPNTWLFGEEYALGTDDENLKTVLEQHVKILGRSHLNPEVRDVDIQEWLTEFNRDKVKTPQSLERIPDLMLWRRFQERRPDEYEFLVIEIKRPKVSIGRTEIAQIEDYAAAVSRTPFRDSDRTNWVFVVISDELDEYAHERAHQANAPAFQILKSEKHRYEIQARPWSQFIQSARARHDHLQKWLGYSVSKDHMFDWARETYGEFLPPLKSSSVKTSSPSKQTATTKKASSKLKKSVAKTSPAALTKPRATN
jgi:hypothetical protein